MSLWFKRFLGLVLLVTTVGIATCQSLVKADSGSMSTAFSKPSSVHR
jgi:hypothetical protein